MLPIINIKVKLKKCFGQLLVLSIYAPIFTRNLLVLPRYVWVHPLLYRYLRRPLKFSVYADALVPEISAFHGHVTPLNDRLVIERMCYYLVCNPCELLLIAQQSELL